MKQFGLAPKLALLLLVSLPAVAQKPTITLSPLTSFFISATDGCGFDVLLTPQPGRPNGERVIQFANTAIVVGPLFVTATNLSTHKSVNLNISGPETFSFSGMTFVSHGPSLVPLPADVAQAAGLPKVLLINGLLVVTLDAQGNFTSVQTVNGTVQDLCPLLQ